MLFAMFIRRTGTRTGAGGEVYYSHRLVRSERTGEKVRQRTLLNLGSDFPLDRHHWSVLCARIRQLLDRQTDLAPLSCPQEVEDHAQRLVARLLNGAPCGGGPDLQTVDVGTLELIRPRSVGVEHVGLWAMEELGLAGLLERLGLNGPQRAPWPASSRAWPGSERASWRWLCERSALGELLDVDFERMSPMRLYRASDALMSHRATIEAHLFDRATDLFGLRRTVTLYELTDTFFEGGAAAQSKAERGHSKEKRSDCPLLTLGLVLDGSGFVRCSEVFSGAVNEDRTLASMLEALGAPADALVVMDAGIATEANIAWRRANGTRYLAVSRERTRRFDPELAQAIETRSPRTVHVHKVVDPDSGETARAVTWKRRPLAGSMLTHPGVYCLRTNVGDGDEETLWRTYTSLTDVEATFRSLKSERGLRPIFHQTQTRSDGHLFITVIAYQMVQTIRHRLAGQGQHASWASLRAILEGQQRVTATFLCKDRRTLHVRKATRAEPGQLEIYRVLALDPAPGGVRKMIV